MSIQNDILSTLSYFDLFDYPLKKNEVFLFLPNTCVYSDFSNAVSDLLIGSSIFKIDGFYSLRNGYDLSYRRKQGNKKAKELMLTAEKVAALLIKFPFVRGVGVSGSLSKNFADDDSDIDFFIITEKNRLWIARTIMHCFKKFTFLVDKQHFFCMNYYIDEAMLEIKEKNVYTAIEVVTLVPLEGQNVFNKFFAANTWSKGFLPNNYLRVSSAKERISPMHKKVFESVFNNIAGNMLDRLLMKITCRRWFIKTKKKKVNSRGIVMGMDASRHFSKPDPTFYQEKLLQLFSFRSEETIAKYENPKTSRLSKS